MIQIALYKCMNCSHLKVNWLVSCIASIMLPNSDHISSPWIVLGKCEVEERPCAEYGNFTIRWGCVVKEMIGEHGHFTQSWLSVFWSIAHYQPFNAFLIVSNRIQLKELNSSSKYEFYVILHTIRWQQKRT